MKKIKGFLIIILEILVIVYAITITTLLLARNKFGYTELGNTTLIHINEKNINIFNEFEEGDLILIKKPKFDEVNNGDEVYFYTVQQSKYVIKKGHILNKTGDETGYVYSIDSINGVEIAQEKIIGKIQGESYKKLGMILDILESTFGFLILVILPILLIFIYQLYNLIILIRTPQKKSKKNTNTKKKNSNKKSNKSNSLKKS